MVLVTNGNQSFVLFSYGNIQWGTGSFIGFISPNTNFSFPGPERRPQNILGLGTSSNVDVPGLNAYRVDQEMIIDPILIVKGRFQLLYICDYN